MIGGPGGKHRCESLPEAEKGLVIFSNKKSDPVSGVSGGPEKPFDTASPSIARPAYDKARASGHSIVDECLIMKGDLESEGDILVKGKMFGNIRCKVLIIDTDALVEGGVEAEEVIIRGNSKGTVKADRVRLEKSATVDSDICHQTFSAEEGARIKGALRFMESPLSAGSEETTSKMPSRPIKAGNGISVVQSTSDSPN
jgi:cytoskeletal protein CcmA (bactofilin family)